MASAILGFKPGLSASRSSISRHCCLIESTQLRDRLRGWWSHFNRWSRSTRNALELIELLAAQGLDLLRNVLSIDLRPLAAPQTLRLIHRPGIEVRIVAGSRRVSRRRRADRAADVRLAMTLFFISAILVRLVLSQ